MSQHLFAAFAQSVATRTEKPALFWAREQFSYGRILQQSMWVGERLRTQLEVQPGDRVAIWLRNRPEFVAALFGILAAGGVAVPINNFLKPNEVAYMLEDAGVKVVITEDSSPEALSALQSLLPQIRLLRVEDIPADPATVAFQPANRTQSDLAVLIYTSGTTGKPKGAMLTHGNLLHNVESCRQILQIVDLDRLVLLLPMFHSFMLTVCIFTPLATGAGIVLIKSVQPFKLALREIIRHRATILVGIPQLFQAMAQATLPFWLPWVLRLRMAISGAAPLPRETLEAFERKYRFPLLEGYGLSEAAPVVAFNPLRGVRKPGSVGLPVPDVQVKIVDDHGQELPANEIGRAHV